MGYEPTELFSIIEGKKLVRQYYDGRIEILDSHSGVADMGTNKIKEVTQFMKEDVAEMAKRAEEVHAIAMDVKANFNSLMGAAKDQLNEAQKDIMELQAAMGMNTNFPPPDGGPSG